MNLDPQRRARLAAAKLTALTRAAGAEPGEVVEFGTASATLDGRSAFVLSDAVGPGAVAGAVLWALRRDASSLTIFADGDASDLARWASYFALAGGPITVRGVVGATSVEVAPSPVPMLPERVDAPSELRAVLADAGVEVVDEHGVLRGELLGLEVARLVRWPTATGGDGELHLEAGVGRFDRDATAAVRPDESPRESLARAVESVRRHRHPGAPVHPLTLLARSRWLRASALADPSVVGAATLEPVGLTVEGEGIKDQHPAAAVGTTDDGLPLVVVFSSGVDLAAVPLAADTRAMIDPAASLLLAMPARDLHRATLDLVGALAAPARAVAIDEPWG